VCGEARVTVVVSETVVPHYLLLRDVRQVMRFVTIRFETQLPFSWGYLDTCLFLIVLFLLKVWISMLLLGYSGARRLSFEQMSPVFGNEAYTEPKSPEMPVNIKLDDVTRYGMFKGRIPQ
jgi:hypothetical protein